MGKDWEFVAGGHIGEADLMTVKKLAGLNPNDASQRKKLLSALGLTESMLCSFETEFGNEYEAKETEDLEEDIDLETETTAMEAESMDGEGGRASAFKEVFFEDRCQIYQRICSLKLLLLSAPLVTSKRTIYQELNVIVCHVRTRSYT